MSKLQNYLLDELYRITRFLGVFGCLLGILSVFDVITLHSNFPLSNWELIELSILIYMTGSLVKLTNKPD
ncbi:hypothetical protein AAEU29_18335 [Pseudoalteromonas sp. SSM20]|uniref:hypothetical protein n=1 Tax=Pseudoalteromonas sp. SSM20 TaxID=3139394 RepID=UPI003BABCA9A